jgi:hypothetical protein
MNQLVKKISEPLPILKVKTLCVRALAFKQKFGSVGRGQA